MIKNIGVTTAWQGATVSSVRSVASAAEECGFGYLWIPEAWGLEVSSVMAHVLTLTSKIKIGAGIMNVYSRSAALIGMTYATLEQTSPGRTLLGLGSSGRGLVENWHGAKFEAPLKRTKEYVEVIRKVASGNKVEFDGEVLKLSRFRLYTKPASSLPKIFLGAIGERNLKLAGSISDGAILATYPKSRLAQAVRLVSEKGPKRVFVYYPFRIVSSEDEAKKAKSEIAENIAFYVASMGSYYAKNLARLGFEQSVNKIVEAHRVGGHSQAAMAVDDSLLGDLSLIGSREQVLQQLSEIPEDVVPVLGLKVASEDQVRSGIESLKALAGSG